MQHRSLNNCKLGEAGLMKRLSHGMRLERQVTVPCHSVQLLQSRFVFSMHDYTRKAPVEIIVSISTAVEARNISIKALITPSVFRT